MVNTYEINCGLNQSVSTEAVIRYPETVGTRLLAAAMFGADLPPEYLHLLGMKIKNTGIGAFEALPNRQNE